TGFADWPTARDLDALYAERAARAGAPALRFAENVRKEDKRDAGRVVLDALYDGRIAQRGEVPTRERDWHDFFNALCFATFPRAKHALHTRQYRALAARVKPEDKRLPNARTPEQDALTLFDEGGAVIAAQPSTCAELAAATEADRLSRLLQLMAAGRARVVPFGHALFEHLVEGLRCPGGCTQTLALPELPAGDEALLDAVDAALASALQDAARFLSPRDCAHIRLQDLQLHARSGNGPTEA
ncbi:MAG TPA: DUF3025 domain-containing protein, partial [Polyangiales bacterium]|nr:DUF3025 domain-containing protein [Polyangiales bacterium]